jgi:hypothetical protein
MKYLLIAFLFIACNQKNDSGLNSDVTAPPQCDAIVDSLNKKLFVANLKLERVRYYLAIAQKNPSQTKFLKGWINRALDSVAVANGDTTKRSESQ